MLVLALGAATPPLDAQSTTITDLAGREVVLPEGDRTLTIDDARYLIALSLIHEEPTSVLAGWAHDVQRIGESVYEDYRARFGDLASLPRVASSAEPFSLERALAASPDIAVFTVGRGPEPNDVARLESAGIAVVFLDFVDQPLQNLDRSLEILARIVEREERAAAFTELRRSHLALIQDRLAAYRGPQPSVLLEAHAGMSGACCNSPGRGGVGEYVSLVGGRNIGAEILPGTSGTLNLEFVLASDPDRYIATGGPHLAAMGGLVLGPGYGEDEARAALARVADRTGVRTLEAVRSGHTHGIAHQLLNSPIDIVAIELLARWIHPDLFGDLDPEATLDEINDRFLAVPVTGTHWVSLQ